MNVSNPRKHPKEHYSRMANSCQVCEWSYNQTLRGTTPRGYPRSPLGASTRRVDQTKIGPESTGVRLQHLESTRNAVIHRSRLESTSSSSGDCRSSALLIDGVWSPLATPREHQPRQSKIGQVSHSASSGHDNVGPSSDVRQRDGHLVHTIRWGQVTWHRFVQAFNQLGTD